MAAGWALRAIQIAVVATYFCSVLAKIGYSGSLAAWGNSAILTWAVIRRGNGPARWMVEHTPWVFVPAQWAGLLMELCSPVVLFLRGRALHLAVLVLLRILFLPTVVCWAAFLPVERLRELPQRWRERRAVTGSPRPPSPGRGPRWTRPSRPA